MAFKNLVIYEQLPVFLDYINGELGVNYTADTTRTVAHVQESDTGELTILAVVALNNWTMHSVELSIAGSQGRWATRKYISSVYEYAFTYAGKERVHCIVEQGNEPAMELHRRLGHKYEGLLEDWFGADRPAHVFGLTKRNYLKGRWAAKSVS